MAPRVRPTSSIGVLTARGAVSRARGASPTARRGLPTAREASPRASGVPSTPSEASPAAGEGLPAVVEASLAARVSLPATLETRRAAGETDFSVISYIKSHENTLSGAKLDLGHSPSLRNRPSLGWRLKISPV